MTNDWTDQLAGARMQVDQQFQETLEASEFSNQEWGLVMTAVDWEMESPETPEEASLVADTSKLPDVIPELQNIQQGMGGSPMASDNSSSSGGVLGRLGEFLPGLGGGSAESGEADETKVNDAEALVRNYTEVLQAHLKEQDRWEDICAAAAKHQQSG